MSWQSHVHPHGALVPVAPRLWQVTGSMKGMPLPRNMAVYRMADGGLWIHSAICLDEPGMAALEALGPPRVLVVPNGFHRLDARLWKERYPAMEVVCPAAARGRVEQAVRVDAEAESRPPDPGIEALRVPGVKPVELAWLLDSGDGGKALVVCDMLFNVTEHLPGFQGFLLRHVTRSTGFFGLTRIARVAMSVKAPAFRGWLREMADRDLRAVLMAHGDPVTEDVGSRLRGAAATV